MNNISMNSYIARYIGHTRIAAIESYTNLPASNMLNKEKICARGIYKGAITAVLQVTAYTNLNFRLERGLKVPALDIAVYFHYCVLRYNNIGT